jgi:hypothetical protein
LNGNQTLEEYPSCKWRRRKWRRPSRDASDHSSELIDWLIDGWFQLVWSNNSSSCHAAGSPRKNQKVQLLEVFWTRNSTKLTAYIDKRYGS